MSVKKSPQLEFYTMEGDSTNPVREPDSQVAGNEKLRDETQKEHEDQSQLLQSLWHNV